MITIRNEGQGKKCRICALIREKIRKAPTREEKDECRAELDRHCAQNRSDRETSVSPLYDDNCILCFCFVSCNTHVLAACCLNVL